MWPWNNRRQIEIGCERKRKKYVFSPIPEASTSVERVGRSSRGPSRRPSAQSGKQSERIERKTIQLTDCHSKKNIFTFLFILNIQLLMFGVWLCCMCSTVKTCPYFLERVFSGQKDGNVCKKGFQKIFSHELLYFILRSPLWMSGCIARRPPSSRGRRRATRCPSRWTGAATPSRCIRGGECSPEVRSTTSCFDSHKNNLRK